MAELQIYEYFPDKKGKIQSDEFLVASGLLQSAGAEGQAEPEAVEPALPCRLHALSELAPINVVLISNVAPIKLQ